jgi:hypothetical protein
MVAPKTMAVADLTKMTTAAVKKVAGTGRIVKGPLIWGYVLDEFRGNKQLELATAVTNELAASGKAAGIRGLKVEPAVLIKPGKITVGFIEREFSHQIER